MVAASRESFEIAKIRQDMVRLTALIQRALGQIATADRLGMPESQPFISFRTAERIEDLRSAGGGLRATLRRDIVAAHRQLKELELEAKRIRERDYRQVVDRQHQKLLQGDAQADNRARIIIDKAASGRGGLSEEEFTEVRALMVKSLKGHSDFLNRHPSRRGIQEVLQRLGQVMSLGMDDSQVSAEALRAIQNATKKFTEDAKKAFLNKPTPSTAKALVTEIANAQMVGGQAADGVIDQTIVPVLRQKMEDAERRFRHTPTAANCEAMFDAEGACVHMGGPSLPDPPVGLRRLKSGARRMFGPRDTLSAISKEFYGSFSFWDTIVRANWGVFREPDRPRTNVEIAIPH